MTSVPPVIAIDGPSGSGKGSVATAVAARLDFHFLDSGALYRVLGIAALRAGTDLEDAEAVRELAASMDIEFGRDGAEAVWLNGEDISRDIRTHIGSAMASRVGATPAARKALYARQLAFRRPPGLVADGRDMGTVVFPDAALKIFLTASAEERAQRRYKQLIGKGIGAILPDLLRDLKERDARDSERPVSPLKPAEDAIVLETTELTLEEVIERVMALVRERLPGKGS
ncbi:MAG: (d)CMP kinase [Pseudohongiellaceae bacterium]